MLITLMMNLNMFGGLIPPTPTPTDHGGVGEGEGGLSKYEQYRRRMRKILDDDDDFIIIALTKWVAENN